VLPLFDTWEPIVEELKKVEEEKPIHPLMKLTSWKDTIEVTSKIGLTLVGICYVVGLLILNIHLRQYGVFQLNFLQVDYVMVGALWMFLCGSMYFCSFQLLELNKAVHKKWTTSKHRFLRVFYILGGVLIALFASSYVVTMVGNNTFNILSWRAYLIVGVVAFNVGALSKVAEETRLVTKEWLSDSTDKNVKRARTYAIFSESVVFLIALSLYAVLAYPYLSPAYGGGLKQQAEFIIKKDQYESVKNLGISLEDENGRTSPLQIIYEAPDFFIISPPAGFDTRAKVQSIRIRKEAIYAAYYLSNK
jgi:hypothetical protein